MLETLKSLRQFRDYTDEELAVIVDNFAGISHEAGKVIIAPGETGEELFIILKGSVVSTLKLAGKLARKQGRYLPGDFFGEISMFAHKPSYNAYVAAEDCDLLVISEKKLLDLVENHALLGIKLVSHLLIVTIKRLRKSSAFLADVVQWGEKASRRTITDELTGVYNRSFLDDAVENFFNISQSNRKPLSLLMIDIDNFRTLNEAIGHESGDRILLKLVELIGDVISRHGIIARYGGDEFSVLLPEAGLEKSTAIAEEIRSKVEAFDFSGYITGKPVPITTSIGISSFPETATDIASFRERADGALYLAKKTGRNRVAHLKSGE